MNQTEIINIFTKKTLGLTFVLSAAALAFAQEKVGISGSVVNKSNQPVPYASVTFSNKANKQLSDATLTDEKGQYKLDITPGEYDISVEAIDYKKSVVTKQITAAGNIGAFSIDPEASATNMKTGEITPNFGKNDHLSLNSAARKTPFRLTFSSSFCGRFNYVRSTHYRSQPWHPLPQ